MKQIPAPRVAVLSFVLLTGFAAVEWRLIQLQILRHEELAEKAEDYRSTTRVEQSWRGQVLDRYGVPLALTVPVILLSSGLPFESGGRLVSPPGADWLLLALSTVLYLYGGMPFLKGLARQVRASPG